jgi:ABC-2 type transport system ATP-binding protein
MPDIPILIVRDVTKRFAEQTALEKVSIQVNEGSIFGLLGPNGAGKTTLIRIINQITGPDEGEVLFVNNRLKEEHTRLMGYLPEERGLYKKMAVGEQALYLTQLKGLTKHDALHKLRGWFEKFEIQAWWNKKVEELSKGMQQKVQFIITVVHEPKLIIFDEPFSGFDPINVNLLKDEILELKRKGSTIIFSTHNMASVEELCDDIALINKAKKILEGSVNEIKRKYGSNTYEVQFSGYEGSLEELLPSDFKLLQVEKNGHISARIQIPFTSKPNDLLIALMPKVDVIALNEVIPSMNDIFINTVNAVNAGDTNSIL